MADVIRSRRLKALNQSKRGLQLHCRLILILISKDRCLRMCSFNLHDNFTSFSKTTNIAVRLKVRVEPLLVYAREVLASMEQKGSEE
jgi:hypothetical protein